MYIIFFQFDVFQGKLHHFILSIIKFWRWAFGENISWISEFPMELCWSRLVNSYPAWPFPDIAIENCLSSAASRSKGQQNRRGRGQFLNFIASRCFIYFYICFSIFCSNLNKIHLLSLYFLGLSFSARKLKASYF